MLIAIEPCTKKIVKMVNFELYIFNHKKKNAIVIKPAIHMQELMSELHHLGQVNGAMVNVRLELWD